MSNLGLKLSRGSSNITIKDFENYCRTVANDKMLIKLPLLLAAAGAG